jgi:uncharacterized protein HemX
MVQVGPSQGALELIGVLALGAVIGAELQRMLGRRTWRARVRQLDAAQKAADQRLREANRLEGRFVDLQRTIERLQETAWRQAHDIARLGADNLDLRGARAENERLRALLEDYPLRDRAHARSAQPAPDSEDGRPPERDW